MKKIVMGLSGGMDSATLLGILLDQEYEVHCCNFYYASKHNAYERTAFEKIISYYRHRGYPVFEHYFDLSNTFADFKSALLMSGDPIPEGHYEAESMSATVVPGRNSIFATIMAGLAESIGAEAVALGVHSGDHHIYPDCRKEFIKSLDTTIYLGSGGKVQVIAPLLDDNKTSIIQKGLDLYPSIPYGLTRTCYKDQPLSCGKCGSCQERLEAFTNLNLTDPISYDE